MHLVIDLVSDAQDVRVNNNTRWQCVPKICCYEAVREVAVLRSALQRYFSDRK